MAHGDDDGLILPPRIAPLHVVIIPVLHKEEIKARVVEYSQSLAKELSGVTYDGRPLQVEVDMREIGGAEKQWQWIKRGVPIRLEVGPRELEQGAVFVGRRDKGPKERYGAPRGEFVAGVTSVLDEIQKGLLERARAFREANTKRIDSKDEFYAFFTPANAEKPEIHGGFALSHWAGDGEAEAKVKADLNVTIRCIPLDEQEEGGRDVITGAPSKRRVIFAKAY